MIFFNSYTLKIRIVMISRNFIMRLNYITKFIMTWNYNPLSVLFIVTGDEFYANNPHLGYFSCRNITLFLQWSCMHSKNIYSIVSKRFFGRYEKWSCRIPFCLLVYQQTITCLKLQQFFYNQFHFILQFRKTLWWILLSVTCMSE